MERDETRDESSKLSGLCMNVLLTASSFTSANIVSNCLRVGQAVLRHLLAVQTLTAFNL